jgi:hypothetical protein
MASSDASAFGRKNVAYRITFPILDADGDLVTGATGLDSKVSKDGGTFADATNEATEIATASGVYYLDLTSTEMNADTVAVIVKTTSSGAKTTVLVIYPLEDGDIIANTTQVGGQTASASGTVTFPSSISSLTAAGVRSELAVELARIDTNIGSRLSLAGYTAPLSAADTRTAIGLASANLDTQFAALPLASAWTSTRAGYLDSVLLALNDNNRTVQVTGSHHVAAVLHDSEPGSIHATTFDAGAIDAAALATSAANEIADALLDRADAIETGLTLRGAIRLDTAALAGKVSGAAGTSVAIRNVGDTKTRISATVDADGNRTAVTTDAT